MKRTILAIFAALCCAAAGSWIWLVMPAHVQHAVDDLVTLRQAKDCIPREAPGMDCFQYTPVTVISTRYLEGGPGGSMWEARLRFADGSTRHIQGNPITQHTAPGHMFTAVTYNGEFRYLEGYRPWIQDGHDASGLYWRAIVLSMGPLLVVYAVFIIAYELLKIPQRSARFERLHGMHPVPPHRTQAFRLLYALALIFGIGGLVSFITEIGAFYPSTVVWTLPWIYAVIAIAVETTCLHVYLSPKR